VNDNDYSLIQTEVRTNPAIPPEDKEDFVQDICVKLLESKPAYISRPYIRRLLRNMLVDRHRKEIRRPDIIYDNKDYPQND
jgi:DNA-directed RNA polymerase specialized sigma24 family protein